MLPYGHKLFTLANTLWHAFLDYFTAMDVYTVKWVPASI